MAKKHDPLVPHLADLNGQYFQFEGGYYAKFVFHIVPRSWQKPHGFSYSLTLHRKDGERLLGFDNAHAVPEHSGPAARARQKPEFDYCHKGKQMRRYRSIDLATLLDDFWNEVDAVLKKE